MGVERVLQAVVVVATTWSALAHAQSERIALIDLGPKNPAVRIAIEAAIADAKFAVVAEPGVPEALGGVAEDRDAALLAGAIVEARSAFGALDCAKASDGARRAIAIGAARQAAGIAVPELPNAWALVLLCADRAANFDAAMIAAARLRAVGGSQDVPADLMTKYPDVDVLGGARPVAVEITVASAKDARVWIDHVDVGVAPITVQLAPGEHLIAAAGAGAMRGAIVQTITGKTTIAVETPAQRGEHAELAARVAGWQGRVPAPAEIAWVLARVRARIALLRYGDTVEVWGQAGRAIEPKRLGGEDGVGRVDEVPRMLQLVIDRVDAWNDRAPDPDAPLLLDTARIARERSEEPTEWWVYAGIAGAVVGAAVLVYLNDSAEDIQRVRLVYP